MDETDRTSPPSAVGVRRRIAASKQGFSGMGEMLTGSEIGERLGLNRSATLLVIKRARARYKDPETPGASRWSRIRYSFADVTTALAIYAEAARG